MAISHPPAPVRTRWSPLWLLVAALTVTAVASDAVASDAVAADIPPGPAGFKSRVSAFLTKHCVDCHGPQKSKGDLTLHAIDGDLAAGRELERWELILEMLRSGEMPPEERARPDDAERRAVMQWIEAGLRSHLQQTGKPAGNAESQPLTRRLTNFEYENTVRDLLGFRLKLAENLPEDPVKPYHFNNSARFMLMGAEQLDRYRENARRAMASAIVDPVKPKVHRTVRSWQARDSLQGLSGDEIGIYGNRRLTPEGGMGLTSWPATGEFRIRVTAAAVLPPGYGGVPLRLVMGYGLGQNLAMLQIEPVGTVQLTNRVDELKVYEFRGRIENIPIEPGRGDKGRMIPPSIHLTPQNLFDDGRLNDKLDPLALPRVVIRSLEFEAPVLDVWPPEHHRRILFDSPLRQSDPPAYVREVLRRFLSRAWRRPATPDELRRYERIFAIYAGESRSFEAAMRETLAVVLASPQFLYHTVADASTGVTRQYELASKLSYFLWGSMPDETLLTLAEQGRLDDPKVIEAQVLRLLADERAGDFVDNFTTQWLSIAKMKSVKINTEIFPRFLYLVAAGERTGTEMPYRPTIRDYMREETVGFVAELIRRNAAVDNFVNSDFAYLNQPLAAHYGVPGVEGLNLRPVPIKPEHRIGGLLTQGSVLIGNSTGSAPHPIYRAVWLREAILGDKVKDPPAEVPSLSDSAGESAAKAVTIKDILRKHRQVESCNDCHSRLDPWGIPFEQYNAVGRYQPMVPKDGVRVRGFNPTLDRDLVGYEAYLKSVNTVRVQADSRVPNGPNVDGMDQLKSYLLRERKREIAENVIRRLLTYALGRELTVRDRFAVEALLQQSEKNGHRLRDMIVAVCQSTAFRGTSKGANP